MYLVDFFHNAEIIQLPRFLFIK